MAPFYLPRYANLDINVKTGLSGYLQAAYFIIKL